MVQLRSVVFYALIAGTVGTTGTVSESVTPVEKVISLLEDMKTEAESLGKTEATTYAEYSCFCKETTAQKSDGLKTGRDKVLSLSADIEKDTASKNGDTMELDKRKEKHEQILADLTQNTNECQAKKLEYEANEADVSKAIYGLEKAIASMKSTKPALLQVSDTSNLADIVEMATAMGMIKQPMKQFASEILQQKGKSAFLQQKAAVDPLDPAYKYHSDNIISLCEDLKADFDDQKKTLDDDWAEASKTCQDTDSSLTTEKGSNEKAMMTLKGSIESLTSKIEGDLSALKLTQLAMVDDEAYLQDLTKQCETSAAEWDQRSALRKEELATLTSALKILTEKVQPTDAKANLRALLQQSAQTSPIVHKKTTMQEVKPLSQSIAFLQEAESSNHGKSLVIQRSRAGLSAEDRKNLALATLQNEGQRLNSVALQALTSHIAADPFMKVKELIQKLIERLVSESAAEAEKKGYCDTEMSKAEQSRDFRQNDVMTLNAEIAQLEAKRDSLKAEIASLKAAVKDLKKGLQTATEVRAAEKAENLEMIDTAQKGLEALKECMDILQTFYRKSSRVTVLAQVSPVDEDTSGPGFSGAYKGQQTSSVAILGLLEGIQSDYERTIKTRTTDEAKAHADFTEFKRTSESDISAKTQKQEMDEEDLDTTKATITSKMGDLKTNVDLLDKALQELVALNPTCVDSGMSYKERKETREQEIAALKEALCELDGEGVEPECK